MNKIDKVTTTNLDIALRMCNIEINKSILDKVIDLVELIEEKGDSVSIQDICKLQESWKDSIKFISDRLHMDDESGHTNLDLKDIKLAHISLKETTDDLWKVPSLLKVRRQFNHLTLRQMSKKTGLSPATVHRIENGKQCLADNYNKLINFWEQYGTHKDK
jgi:DNA-binding XRE family transcriptional regulator